MFRYIQIIAIAVFVTLPTVRAQSVLFDLQSRPVSPAEIAAGVPAGTVIDLFATTQEDMLALGVRELSGDFFHHELAWDSNVASSALMDLHPTLTADSWFTTPGETLVLGGGFGVKPNEETLWGDLSRDGPVTDFQFGRLTVPYGSTASINGQFDIRGEYGPEGYLFDFSVDAAGSYDWQIVDHVVTPAPQPVLPPPPQPTPVVPDPHPTLPVNPTPAEDPIQTPDDFPTELPIATPNPTAIADPPIVVQLPTFRFPSGIESVVTTTNPVYTLPGTLAPSYTIDVTDYISIDFGGDPLWPDIDATDLRVVPFEDNVIMTDLATPLPSVARFSGVADDDADLASSANLQLFASDSLAASIETVVPEPQTVFGLLIGLVVAGMCRHRITVAET